MKKISIIGAGTGGCLTASILSRNPNLEIDWYFDPTLPAKSVGEGTLPFFPNFLYSDWGLEYKNLDYFDATLKKGIKKINWGNLGDFNHDFPLGTTGIHFNASKYQSYVLKNSSLKNINLIEQNIQNPLELNSNYIIDCTGHLNNKNNYHYSSYIPVNSVHIVQCQQNTSSQEIKDTLTLARPYGWVFGIPLQNRYSVGYLFNKEINSLDEIKEDIKEVFKSFNLTPSNKINSFSFNNYFKKQNFTERIAYNGNSSFFLEPLEATSLSFISQNAYLINDIIEGTLDVNKSNDIFYNSIKQTEVMIMLHYLAGSKFNTSFWKEAKFKANLCINEASKDPLFKKIINLSLKYPQNSLTSSKISYGTWDISSYYTNLKGLGLYNKILSLIK